MYRSRKIVWIWWNDIGKGYGDKELDWTWCRWCAFVAASYFGSYSSKDAISNGFKNHLQSSRWSPHWIETQYWKWSIVDMASVWCKRLIIPTVLNWLKRCLRYNLRVWRWRMSSKKSLKGVKKKAKNSTKVLTRPKHSCVCFNHSIRRYHTQLTNNHKLHQHHQQLDCRAWIMTLHSVHQHRRYLLHHSHVEPSI